LNSRTKGATESRLRLEKKFNVEIPTKKIWAVRQPEKLCNSGSRAPNTGMTGADVYRRDINTGASFSLGCQAEFSIFEFATSRKLQLEVVGEAFALRFSANSSITLIQEMLCEALNKVTEQKQVNQVWILAHLSFMGNECGPTFSKLGSSESPVTAKPHI